MRSPRVRLLMPCIVGTGMRGSWMALLVPSCIVGILRSWTICRCFMTMAVGSGKPYERQCDSPHRRAGPDVTLELVLLAGHLRSGKGAYFLSRLDLRGPRGTGAVARGLSDSGCRR